jgi:excinuclease ABC subunit B
VRPTGLIDPEVVVRPIDGQVDDLLGEIRARVARGRARARDHADQAHGGGLTEYYREVGVKVEYLHSDVETLERVKILASCERLVRRPGRREPPSRGLDLPEVSLVAILDADKEGICDPQAR